MSALFVTLTHAQASDDVSHRRICAEHVASDGEHSVRRRDAHQHRDVNGSDKEHDLVGGLLQVSAEDQQAGDVDELKVFDYIRLRSLIACLVFLPCG